MGKIHLKTKTVKIISIFLIISILIPTVLFSVPKKTNAFWGIFDFGVDTDPLNASINAEGAAAGTLNAGTNLSQLGLKLKDVAKEVLKEVAMAIARKALQEMTKSTINWINGGFHGQPLFLENPESFFKDIAKYEVKTLVDQFGYDSLKYPFGKAFALNTINSYKRTLDDNASYSLSNVINDPVVLRNYQTNFNYGGWNAFLINTQYPQNNYLGFQIVANEELARRIEGTGQTAAGKVQALLQQGQGFLSPQTCPSNPNYNNGKNEWQQPSFNEAEYVKEHPYDPSTQESRDKWTLELAKARAEWAKTNTCPGGLVNTTPGTVVADQIKINLGSGVRQRELAAAMGNSISAIVDALLDKFLTEGLNSLASNVNSSPKTDDWSYNGLTLGGPGEGGTNTTWDLGPDELVILSEFKKILRGKTIVTITDANGTETTKEEIGNTGNGTYIPGDIANTENELALIDNTYAKKPLIGNPPPGIIQMLSTIWPKARELDICIPGPDIGWENRLEDEKNKGDERIQGASSGGSESQRTKGNEALKELKFAVDFFNDWIHNKIMLELPSSVLYMDAVEKTKTLTQQSDELMNKKQLKIQVLARLRSINAALDAITVQPATDSGQEKALISLWKQYKAAKINISNSITLANTKNELDTAEDQLADLNNLIIECNAERKAKGWGLPGGWNSSLVSTTKTPTITPAIIAELGGIPPNSEQAIFCNLPVIGGYTHGTFINSAGVTSPEIPMVNAKKILKYKIITIGSFLGGGLTGNPYKTAYVNIKLSCSNIFNANILDYKGKLPGPTTIIELFTPLPDDTDNGNLGICTFSEGEQADMSQEDCAENGGDWTSDGAGN